MRLLVTGARGSRRLDRRLRERFLQQENKKWPVALATVPRDQWPMQDRYIGLLRSRSFLVQVFAEPVGVRLSICRTELEGWDGENPLWKEGISWDELQELKRQAGFADRWAVEIFPPDAEVVNVANMRHLWVLSESPNFGWKSK